MRDECFQNISPSKWQDPGWQERHTIRAAGESRSAVKKLSRILTLNDHQREEIGRTLEAMIAQGKEPLRITPYYASLMAKNPFNPRYEDGSEEQGVCPIFWQAVPTPAHLLFPDAGVEGLMAEHKRSFGAAYQRYPNRLALFVAANTSCANYCSFCQRAKSLDAASQVSQEDIDRGLFYINWNKNIDEVLITGGDALRIGKKRLKRVLDALGAMEHIKALRIATRVPVNMPMGVTEELLDVISRSHERYGKHIYFMTHINHYREITDEMKNACRRIQQRGFMLLNQTVLLNHINADYATLADTFRKMWWAGIKPYYLLQCHKERGLAHFIKPIQYGKIMISHLQGWNSGTAKPIYAVNSDHGGGKILLMPSGYDTRSSHEDVVDQIYSPSATIHTWDGRVIADFEALGRATREQYDRAIDIMDRFIGRPRVFKPSMIIVNEDGEYVETTNRNLPTLTNLRKANLLGYEVQEDGMPITNPAKIADRLEAEYQKSRK